MKCDRCDGYGVEWVRQPGCYETECCPEEQMTCSRCGGNGQIAVSSMSDEFLADLLRAMTEPITDA